MINLNDRTFGQFRYSNGYALILFGAEYCTLCKKAERKLIEFGEKHQIRTGKVDLMSSPRLANRYLFRQIPVLILFKDGKEVSRVTGVSFRHFAEILKGGEHEEDQVSKALP